IAAATACNAWRVPILSPVPSDQRIDELGSWVFQTKVSTEVEVSAVARVARKDLLLERFAVLAPHTDEKRRLAQLFVQEILSRGGVIVTEQYYKTGDTDFKDQLETIRDAAPEALFIPGEPEELILVLPQVSFYDMRVQLIGLSNWNSDKLLRLSRQEVEGAIFPDEAVYGKDRETNQRFAASYRERFGGEVHAVATAGYFGARLLLEAVRAGAIDRAQVREFLDGQLKASGEQRVAAANALSILKVRGGEIREFHGRSRTR
ncbi:MAG: ABC transporter substrate-binding protein, partial [Candidatus Krumholzibacteria bacterium]|nr:ABC transporter substrate-binding protein [Candidatus Krumholzibacteria bacterium]